VNSASGNLATSPPNAANSESSSTPQQRAALHKLAGKKRRHDEALAWDDDRCSTYVGLILRSSSCRGPIAIPEEDARKIDRDWFVRLNSWSDWIASYSLGFTSYRPTGGSSLFPFLKNILHQTRTKGALRMKEEDMADEAHILTKRKTKERMDQYTKTFETQETCVTVLVPSDVSVAFDLAQGKEGEEGIGDTTGLLMLNVLKKGKCNETLVQVDCLTWVGRFLSEEHNAKDRSSPGTEQSNCSVTPARTTSCVLFLPPFWIVNGPLKKCKLHVDPYDQHGGPLDEESYRGVINQSRGVWGV
jgi:hypothetical protein